MNELYGMSDVNENCCAHGEQSGGKKWTSRRAPQCVYFFIFVQFSCVFFWSSLSSRLFRCWFMFKSKRWNFSTEHKKQQLQRDGNNIGIEADVKRFAIRFSLVELFSALLPFRWGETLPHWDIYRLIAKFNNSFLVIEWCTLFVCPYAAVIIETKWHRFFFRSLSHTTTNAIPMDDEARRWIHCWCTCYTFTISCPRVDTHMKNILFLLLPTWF